MNIWIVAIADFPEGRGATPRIRNIGAGLVERGSRVEVLLSHAAGYVAQGVNIAVRGEWQGMSFEFLNRRSDRPRSDVGVALAKIRSHATLVWKFLRGRRPDAIWFYSHSLIDVGLLFVLAKIAGRITVLDVSDERFDVHALGQAKSPLRRINAIQGRISDILFFKWASGFAVVSEYLKSKVVELSRGQPIVSLPLVARVDEAPDPIPPPADGPPSAAYVGSFTPDEGLEFLLDVINVVRERVPNFTCSLYGAANHQDYDVHLRGLVAERGLSEIVRFEGMLPYGQIIERLRRHRVVVLPRLDSVISRAGFPGKLSEYVSSLRPIVATPFGDFCKYFRHGESAYIARSFNVRDYADVLVEALEHPTDGFTVAKRAYLLGRDLFDYRAVASTIERFLLELISSDRRS